MKLLLSALLLAAVPAVLAQNPSQTAPAPPMQTQPPITVNDLVAHKGVQLSADACPLTLTSVQLDWPGTYMPVTSAEKVMEPNLALGFQNSSGRAIRTVVVTAALRVKKDVYALDATPVEVHLSFAGTRDLNKELNQLAAIPLPKGLHEYGVVQVRLDQVLFADGTMWKAAAKQNSCRVRSFGLIAAK